MFGRVPQFPSLLKTRWLLQKLAQSNDHRHLRTGAWLRSIELVVFGTTSVKTLEGSAEGRNYSADAAGTGCRTTCRGRDEEPRSVPPAGRTAKLLYSFHNS